MSHTTAVDAPPLSGVKVVELTHWMAGPLAGALLADWGADVVRVEPPGGDPMRALYASLGARADAPNGGFIAANRGKRSIVLTIKEPTHRAVFDRLLERADVLLTNLRPDALERLELSPAEVATRFPRLVYCPVSAYGWTGPDRDRPGYDLAAFFARTGIAHEITTEGSAPAALMQGIGDSFTAMSAAAGILAALHARRASGRGCVVEASLLRTGMWALAGELGVQAMGGNPRPPVPREQCRTPLYNSYRTADGRWFFLVGVQAKRQAAAVLAAIDRVDLVDDERFASARAIAANRSEIIALLDVAFAAQPLAHWAERFDAHDVVWAPIQTPADVVADRQAVAAGAWIEVDAGPDAPPVRSVEAPIRFGGARRARVKGVPAIGEHTHEVLRELGYDAGASERIAASAAR
jgi:crotonobetainyl-CoA:carnitine CoA-transferase CaiB-like acyl-CoA transferase